MAEKLTIKRLGPIEEFTIEPKPLTIIIGEQASGKSLVAQLLYFFRSFKTFVAKNYTPRMAFAKNWESAYINQFLNDLRGVSFASFINGAADLTWREKDVCYQIGFDSEKFAIPNDELRSHISSWVESWSTDKKALEDAIKSPGFEDQIFIPTDRSVFTRLWGQAQSVLFAPYQPQPLRSFGDLLSLAYPTYRKFYRLQKSWPEESKDLREAFQFILKRQRNALGGEAYAPIQEGPQEWKWKIDKNETTLTIPIEAATSGQMEGWPFFVIASTFGILSEGKTFYFEEPETHLHPQAQVEVMKAIGYLVNRGQQFVITTHSPFLLYVVNNMLQRYVTHKGNAPDNENGISLSLKDVVAYRLGGQPEKISDEKETGLINLEELEQVADELGGEFDQLLDKMDKAR